MKALRVLVCLMFISLAPVMSYDTSVTAYAGHGVINGLWCQCGCAACICDPGETPGACTNSVTYPTKVKSESVDYGSGVLLILLALFAVSRIRA